MKNTKAKELFNKAIELGKRRKYKESSVLLHEIIEKNDTIPEAYLFLGRCYHSLSKPEESIQILSHYLTMVPDSPAGNFFLGRSLLSAGQANKSIYFLRNAVKFHPDSSYANGFLGIAYLKSGRSDLALNFLTKAVESSKTNNGIYKIYLGTLFIRGINSFKSGDYDYSEQIFQFLINTDFESILPYIYMGMIERQRENYRKALEYYEKAIDISPDDELLLYRRAVLLHKVGKNETAVKELKKLNIEPNMDENIFLAFKYYESSDFNKAVYYGNLSLHEDPSNTDIHLLLGEVNRELNKLDISENHYNLVLKYDKSRIDARYGLALLSWLKNDYEKMLSDLKKIEVNDPGNSISSYYAALCKCRLNYNTEETIPLIQAEIRKNGPDCFLLTALGEEYIKGDLEELSEKWFLKAIKLNTNYKDSYLNLINLYISRKNKSKLLKLYSLYLSNFDDINYQQKYISLLYKEKKYKKTIKEILKISSFASGNEYYLRLLANSYRMTEQWSKGIIIYKKLLQLKWDNEIYLKGLIFCLDKNNETETAIEILEKAMQALKKPTNDLTLIQGVLSYKLERYDEALKAFRASLNSNSGDWRVYNNIAMIYQKKGLDDYAAQFFSRAMEYKNK